MVSGIPGNPEFHVSVIWREGLQLAVRTDQRHICLVDQGRGLKRSGPEIRMSACVPPTGELAIDMRQQLAGGVGIALLIAFRS